MSFTGKPSLVNKILHVTLFHNHSSSFAIFRDINSDRFSRMFTKVRGFWQELTDKFTSFWKNSKSKINKQFQRFRILPDMSGRSGKSLVTLWTWHPTSVQLRGRLVRVKSRRMPCKGNWNWQDIFFFEKHGQNAKCPATLDKLSSIEFKKFVNPPC